MAAPPPPANSISTLVNDAEGLTRNTGVIVMLIVGIELVITFAVSKISSLFPTLSRGSILTAILPLQTALVGYANKDAANQRQALMAISAVSILSLSHLSNWMTNAFSWTGFAMVGASSASILLQKVVVGNDVKTAKVGTTKASMAAGDNLTSLVMRNRDFFQVLGDDRSALSLCCLLFICIVLLSLMAVAAADTHGFERIVLSFCSVAVFFRFWVIAFYSIFLDERLPELCEGLYGIKWTLEYYPKTLPMPAGWQAQDDLHTHLKVWLEAQKSNCRDVVFEAIALAPSVIRVELATQSLTSFTQLIDKAAAVGFGPGRKLRWSKVELNLFLVWYASLFLFSSLENEGEPGGEASKDEEAV